MVYVRQLISDNQPIKLSAGESSKGEGRGEVKGVELMYTPGSVGGRCACARKCVM